jgi:hypothetical protein
VTSFPTCAIIYDDVSFYNIPSNVRVSDELLIETNLEDRNRGLIEVLTRNLFGKIEENDEEPQSG